MPAGETLVIGAVQIVISDDGWLTTKFPDGREVVAVPHEDPRYRAMMHRVGCKSPEALNQQHEIVHTLLAHWLDIGASPVLRGECDPRCEVKPDLFAKEEAAVLALQEFANALGVDLMEVARRS